MTVVTPRHGELSDFLALSDGLSIARVAEMLRCCTRTIRNYVAGRSPISWHRVELLRLLVRKGTATTLSTESQSESCESKVTANIASDPDAPDVSPAEMLAWFGVHAPHYLSSQRSFQLYVRGWRVLALELPKSWRSGRLWNDLGPPAYFKA
jgi:hypothetical protein